AAACALFVASHTSDVHRAVERALPPGARYVFTPPHEGGARRPGVVRIGQSPLEEHAAALAWVAGARGGEGSGQALVPSGPGPPGPLLDLVLHSRADAVLLSLVGRDLVAFNRE